MVVSMLVVCRLVKVRLRRVRCCCRRLGLTLVCFWVRRLIVVSLLWSGVVRRLSVVRRCRMRVSLSLVWMVVLLVRLCRVLVCVRVMRVRDWMG